MPSRGAADSVPKCVGRVEGKNGWQFAEAVGDVRPQDIERLLTAARRDAEEVRNDHRASVVNQLRGRRVVR